MDRIDPRVQPNRDKRLFGPLRTCKACLVKWLGGAKCWVCGEETGYGAARTGTTVPDSASAA
jgi:hypothetical protein